MSVNNAENGVDNHLSNMILRLRRDFDEYKGNVQPIGNGSLNYAVLGSDLSWGPTTIAAGATGFFFATLFDIGGSYTFEGQPAINKRTLLDLLVTYRVDTNDAAHHFPGGGSLTAGQAKMAKDEWFDLDSSGLSDTNGQRRLWIQITNNDSSSHNYYIRANILIPRPALKPL